MSHSAADLRGLPGVRTLHSRAFLWAGILLLLGGLFPPASAWNPPAAQEELGRPLVNGQPTGDPMVSYFAESAWDGVYNVKGHAYILQHAIRLLRADGYTNWADLAQANLLHLMSGAAHADGYMGRIEAVLQLEILWGLFSYDLQKWDITCRAGCDHYYNVSSGAGLQMMTEMVGAAIIDNVIAKFAFNLGPVGLDADVVPTLLGQYPSAVDLCQQHFDRAVDTWKQGSYIYPSRGASESSFYELGWACHLVADMAVAQHQHNSFIGGHADYEDFADGKGDPQRYPAYHPASAKPYGAYHHVLGDPSGGWPAQQFARAVAERIYHDPDNYPLAEDGGDVERDKALSLALPLAEAFTAGLIARYMSETGVPPVNPPLQGWVRGDGGQTLPGAYVFYASVGSTIQIEQNESHLSPVQNFKGWNLIRADAQGRYALPAQPNTNYLIRAALPGYSFEGKTGANLEFGQPACPVVYSQGAGLISGNNLDLFLKRLTQMVTGLVVGTVGGSPSMAPVTGLQPVAAAHPTLLAAGARLAQSGTEVSPALAEAVARGVMDVKTDHSVLGARNGGTGLPETATVTVQLCRLVELSTGKQLTSGSQVLAAIDSHRLATAALKNSLLTAQPGPQSLSHPGLITQEAWLAAKPLLPQSVVPGPGAQTHRVIRVGGEGAALGSRHSLLGAGLVAVPTLGGAEIEVSVEPGSGRLTSTAAPVKLVTNSEGRAAVRVEAGSHAGVMRLKFRVVHNPQGSNISPEDSLELILYPRVQGADPTPAEPPVLTPTSGALMMVGTVTLPGPQPVQHVTVKLGGKAAGTAAAPSAGGSPALTPEQIRLARIAQARGESGAASSGSSRPTVTQNFEDERLPGWELLQNAHVEAADAGHLLALPARAEARWNQPGAADCMLGFRFRLGSAALRVVVCSSGEAPNRREYWLTLSGGEIALVRYSNGQEQTLAVAPAPVDPATWHTFRVGIRAGQFEVEIDRQDVLTIADPQPLPGGGSGLLCLQGEGLVVDDVHARVLNR